MSMYHISVRKAREEAVQMQRDVQNQLEAETQANQDLQVIIKTTLKFV